MYFTALPDHSQSGFDEKAHFSKFKKHNIIFYAQSSNAHCENHVGCLSFKTLLTGEEWYGINNQRIANRPGQFLILNDEQNYSCHIDNNEKVRILSIFFKKEFATKVFRDTLYNEDSLLDDPFNTEGKTLEFFQTLKDIDSEMEKQLSRLIGTLESWGDDNFSTDEYLIFLLEYLIHSHKSEANRICKVDAVKSTTRLEIFKRLCAAKDILHSSYMDKPDLNEISIVSCLSVPQLVRQFRCVFHMTPHQYLIRIRLKRASELLKLTNTPIHEITWRCGFENVSSFCRAFKSRYGVQPGVFRKMIR